ncbi:hydroxyproline-rich glycoprotein family protein [Euphorbia peplus]|nr:hydroxyproline-rich glycoprotein family protein [Euphorbia peplus]
MNSVAEGVPTVQTWNNQYYRNEPVVVVADQNSVLDQYQKKKIDLRVGEKPLLLPVRSLKSRVFEADAREESLDSPSRSFSSSSSKRISSNLEENLKNNVVLPSPIPWRSRSGRIEFKETKQEQQPDSPMYSPVSSSMEESEFNKCLKAQTCRVSGLDSSISSPKLASSPNHFSIEKQGKCAENFVRKKSIYRSPPPPPPPPHLTRTSKTTKPKDEEIFSPRRKEFPEEEKEVEKIVLESEEDLETEDDEEDDGIESDMFVSLPSGGRGGGGGSSSGDAGPDVDKKADEFIAKFREHIRLQRIESILDCNDLSKQLQLDS